MGSFLQKFSAAKEKRRRKRSVCLAAYEDLAINAASATERQQFLSRAAEIYGAAYRFGGCYCTGINAATMSLLVGETERACELARKVRAQYFKEIEDPLGDSYWGLAALGEAALICREWAQAEPGLDAGRLTSKIMPR